MTPAFWAIIAFIDLPNNPDLDNCKRRLLETYDRSTLEAAGVSFEKCTGKLYGVLDQWAEDNDTSFDLGDDGFGDLLGHIVAMGEAEYNAVLVNPSLAKARADRLDFEECFSSVFPWGDDFEALNVDHHAAEARKYLPHFEAMVEVLAKTPRDWRAPVDPFPKRPEEVEEALRRVTETRDALALLAGGRIEEFFAAFAALDFKENNGSGKPYSLAFGFASLRLSDADRKVLRDTSYQYIVPNLHSDAKAFLGD